MNKLKKGLMLLGSMGLVFTLTACNNNNSSDNKNTTVEKNITISDILNGDKKRQIVMTKKTEHTESPQIKWAGTIGNGKIDVHPYTNKTDFEFDEIKDLNKVKEFENVLKEEDKDYEEYGENKKLDIVPRDTTVLLGTDKSNETKGWMLDIKGLEGNEEDKSAVLDTGYAEPGKNSKDGWLDIQTKTSTDLEGDEITPDVLYIKAENNKENLVLENADKATKKYENVEKIDID